VSNALKFTDRGEVIVRAAFDQPGGRLRVEVSDTGIGIDEADLDRIFDEFVQVPGAHQIGVKGTGLGLSVSRGLAALLGGDVGAISAPGSGSTFWVDVPAIHVRRGADEASPAASASSATVLVVDDDPTARYLVHHQVAAHGLRVVEAGTGADGIEIARREGPDVVVLDLSMPDLDGLEVLARLRADAATASIPVIVHSARQLTDDERRTIDGFRASVVAKDASPGSVAAAVERSLGSGRAAEVDPASAPR
jgi:CheY-like chemotaxis protein